MNNFVDKHVPIPVSVMLGVLKVGESVFYPDGKYAAIKMAIHRHKAKEEDKSFTMKRETVGSRHGYRVWRIA